MPKIWLSCKKQKIWLPRQQNKNLTFMSKIKNLASMPTKQNLVLKKLGFYATKSGFHTKQTKIGFYSTKFGSHATKTGFHAINKTWLSRHKNLLSCQKPASMPQTKLWLLCHQNSVFTPSKIRLLNHKKTKLFATKFGFHAQTKLLTKDFHKMTTF